MIRLLSWQHWRASISYLPVHWVFYQRKLHAYPMTLYPEVAVPHSWVQASIELGKDNINILGIFPYHINRLVSQIRQFWMKYAVLQLGTYLPLAFSSKRRARADSIGALHCKLDCTRRSCPTLFVVISCALRCHRRQNATWGFSSKSVTSHYLQGTIAWMHDLTHAAQLTQWAKMVHFASQTMPKISPRLTI